jgi:hypothetical protein
VARACDIANDDGLAFIEVLIEELAAAVLELADLLTTPSSSSESV